MTYETPVCPLPAPPLLHRYFLSARAFLSKRRPQLRLQNCGIDHVSWNGRRARRKQKKLKRLIHYRRIVLREEKVKYALCRFVRVSWSRGLLQTRQYCRAGGLFFYYYLFPTNHRFAFYVRFEKKVVFSTFGTTRETYHVMMVLLLTVCTSELRVTTKDASYAYFVLIKKRFEIHTNGNRTRF